MAGRIERIYLRACRGATTSTELILDPTKPLVVIYGENGTGKSTLVDAIDIVCNGHCGSLDERGSATTRQHVRAAGHRPEDVAVELTTAGQTWRAGLTGRGIAVAGPLPRPTAHILRRAQLLRLVEAQPAQRFEVLKRFIDVEGVARGEQALASAVRAAAQEAREASQRRQDAGEALAGLWAAEGRPGAPGETAESWAAAKAVADLSTLQASVSRLQGLLESIDRGVAAREPAVAAHAARREKAAAFEALEQEVAAADEVGAGEGIALLDLLQETRRHLETAPASDACPICRHPAEVGELRRQIDERLAAMTAMLALRERLQAARRERDAADLLAEQNRERFVAAARALVRSSMTDAADLESVAGLQMNWTEYPILLSPEAPPGLEAAREANRLLSTFVAARARIARALEAGRTDLNQYHALAQLYERLSDADWRHEKAERLHQRLSAAFEIVRGERLTFTQRVLDDVATECNRLFARIHPGESLALARFRLDENRKGSLHQEATFEEWQDVPPQAYFSEAHLDTLAFCFFLAIARHSSQGEAFLVLDDIFTSVDAEHLDRIAALLEEESAHFGHILLTTHSEAWRDRFANGADSLRQVVELAPWSVAAGIRPSLSHA